MITTFQPYDVHYESAYDEMRHPLEYRLEKRELWLTSAITEDTFVQQAAWLSSLLDQSQEEPIKLFVHSPGGDVEQALSIASLFENCGCPIVSIAVGMVHSASLMIYMSGTLRLSYPNSFFLLHAMTYNSDGSVTENEEHSIYAKTMIEEGVRRLASKTKWQDRKWRSIYNGRAASKFLSMQKMIDAGVVHHVVSYPEIGVYADRLRHSLGGPP